MSCTMTCHDAVQLSLNMFRLPDSEIHKDTIEHLSNKNEI